MKMDDNEFETELRISADSDIRKTERARNDLISVKLGQLLLQGFRMLNETCPDCDCIYMQKKNEPTYCVGCQDKDVLVLTQKLKSLRQPLEIDEYVAITPNSEPAVKQEQQSELIVTETSGLVKLLARNSALNSGEYGATVDVLRSKISWATEILKSTTNVTDITQLCIMIKSAAEAINSLRLSNV